MVSNLALFVRRLRRRLAFFTSVASFLFCSRTFLWAANKSSMSVLTCLALVVPRTANAARSLPPPLPDACETADDPLVAAAPPTAALAVARVRAMAAMEVAGKERRSVSVLRETRLPEALGFPTCYRATCCATLHARRSAHPRESTLGAGRALHRLVTNCSRPATWRMESFGSTIRLHRSHGMQAGGKEWLGAPSI